MLPPRMWVLVKPCQCSYVIYLSLHICYHIASTVKRGLIVSLVKHANLLLMNFPKRLAALRKQRRLTQQQLAEQVCVHISQIRRYEGADTQPTLDVIRKLAVALGVSADMLIFDQEEREPDNELKLQFEAIKRFTPEEKQVTKLLLESLILKHDSTRFSPQPSND